MKSLACIIVIALIIIFTQPALAVPSSEASNQEKELNFVFLHGAGGNSGDLQGLSDQIIARLPTFVGEYEAANPGVKLNIGMLNRYYPNDVDINTWANNVVDSLNKYFNKDNLILIGHSMGGKTALYATSHNTGGITDKVAAVVTINSPIKNFSQYYFVGGVNYWRSVWMLPQGQGVLSSGVLNSIAYYDSSQDGRFVGINNHWLALVSGESSPTSEQFDVRGVDPLPRNMDDKIVPISAQYAEGADVVFYGEHSHSEFVDSDELAGVLADQILRYIFGKRIDISLPAKSGTFNHEAGWMPIVERWEDSVGSDLVGSGTIIHRNDSYFKWQTWEDVVGDVTGTTIGAGSRDSYKLHLSSVPILTRIIKSNWQSDNSEECRVYVKTRAAPRSTVQVVWSVNRNPLLAGVFPRNRFEVEITSGTPFTGIDKTTWLNNNPLDQKLRINSNAEGPYRWFQAQWRTYITAPRVRNIMSEIH